MFRRLLFLFLAVFMFHTSYAESIRHVISRVFTLASRQLPIIDSNVSSDRSPVTFENGSPVDGKLNAWTSGFYPGSLWIAYEYSHDPELLDLALRHTARLDGIIQMKTHHDIGFQVHCSFGHQYRLRSDSLSAAMIGNAARKLSGRFSPVVGAIKSWDNKRWMFPVIIDNMMNLELLLEASAISGDQHLREVAVTHALTTMKNHFRGDFSSWHLLSYDPETGDVLRKQTVQGFSDESAWSRGQSWGLYGYTMVYRYTCDERFLAQACAIADYILGMLPSDGIPEWDFNAPGTGHAFDMNAKGAPSARHSHLYDAGNVIRDASAGAITASALVELSQYVGRRESKRYMSCALRILRTLSSPEYLATEGTNGGFLLKHSVTNLHNGTGVDIPLTYADYYFLEALLRLHNLGNR